MRYLPQLRCDAAAAFDDFVRNRFPGQFTQWNVSVPMAAKLEALPGERSNLIPRRASSQTYRPSIGSRPPMQPPRH